MGSLSVQETGQSPGGPLRWMTTQPLFPGVDRTPLTGRLTTTSTEHTYPALGYVTDMTDQDDIRKAAVSRLKAQSAFWRLLITFAILWVVMIVIWALGSPRGFFWPAWVIFGTGIALAFTGINAFGPRNKGISQAKIDEEMKKFDSDS